MEITTLIPCSFPHDPSISTPLQMICFQYFPIDPQGAQNLEQFFQVKHPISADFFVKTSRDLGCQIIKPRRQVPWKPSSSQRDSRNPSMLPGPGISNPLPHGSVYWQFARSSGAQIKLSPMAFTGENQL